MSKVIPLSGNSNKTARTKTSPNYKAGNRTSKNIPCITPYTKLVVVSNRREYYFEKGCIA